MPLWPFTYPNQRDLTLNLGKGKGVLNVTSRAGAQVPVNLSHNLQAAAHDRWLAANKTANKIGERLDDQLDLRLGDQSVIDFRQDLTRIGG